jgi:hypothetical protein
MKEMKTSDYKAFDGFSLVLVGPEPACYEDIHHQIDASTRHLGLHTEQQDLVFHRYDMDDMRIVIKKANSYALLSIQNYCTQHLSGLSMTLLRNSPFMQYLHTFDEEQLRRNLRLIRGEIVKQRDTTTELVSSEARMVHYHNFLNKRTFMVDIRPMLFHSDEDARLPYMYGSSTMAPSIKSFILLTRQSGIPIGFYLVQWETLLQN